MGADVVQQERRLSRYTRRQRSSEYLIREARKAEGLPAWDSTGARAMKLDEETGELLPNPAWVRPPRPARCRWRRDADVSVWHDDEKGAHWSGTERCASVWCCPVCSAVIRSERAADIQQGVEKWQAQGGGLMFVTYTLRHKKSDKLADLLDLLLGAYRSLQMGREWQHFKTEQGIRGSIKAVELTHGMNGDHPHLHVLYFLAAPASKATEKAWKEKLVDRWINKVTALGGAMPSELYGVDVRAGDSHGKVLGQYLAKVQEHDDKHDRDGKKYQIGTEMARFDMKAGRRGSLTPFEVLDLAEDTGTSDWWVARWWHEYYLATKGRHAIQWSRGLRELLGLGQMKKDQEVVDDAAKADNLVMVVAGAEYDQIKNRPKELATVLSLIEFGMVEEARDHVAGSIATDELRAATRGDTATPTCGDSLTRGDTATPIPETPSLRLTRGDTATPTCGDSLTRGDTATPIPATAASRRTKQELIAQLLSQPATRRPAGFAVSDRVKKRRQPLVDSAEARARRLELAGF